MGENSYKRKNAFGMSDLESKKLKRTVREATAVKVCRDNFKGYSEEEIYLVKNDDEAVIFDGVLIGARRKKKDIRFSVGVNFYRRVKDRHPRKKLKLEAMKIPTPAEVVEAPLMKAMVAAKKHRSDHSLMVAWVKAYVASNKTSLIGITKWALGLNSKSNVQAVVAIAFCRFVARTNVKTHYPVVFEEAIVPHVQHDSLEHMEVGHETIHQVEADRGSVLRHAKVTCFGGLPDISLGQGLGCRRGLAYCGR